MFDVAGRLAAAEPLLDDIETYLAACNALGHRCGGPDLRQLYTAELGLDVAALDADQRSMLAAAKATQGIVSLQHSASGSLADGWSGAAGVAAAGLAAQHDTAARTVADGLGRAAAALATLRDELTGAVDRKVAVLGRLGDQLAGRRDTWRAVAQSVLGGGGDQSVASEVVDQQIAPFVDAVVFGEVVPALQSATEDVVQAYDSAISAVSPAAVRFDIPGDFGPAVAASSFGPAIGTAAMASAVPSTAMVGSAAGAVPAAWSPPPMAAEMPAVTAPGPVAAPVTEPAGAGVGAAALPEPAPSMSTGTPDLGIGSGVGGFGRQLSDLLGGALGSAAGLAPATGLSDLTGGFDELADGPDGPDPGTEQDQEPEADDAESDDVDDESDPAEDGPAQDDSTEGGEETADAEERSASTLPAAAVNAEPPLPASPPPAEPLAVHDRPIDKTPCQIAADELPQVGA